LNIKRNSCPKSVYKNFKLWFFGLGIVIKYIVPICVYHFQQYDKYKLELYLKKCILIPKKIKSQFEIFIHTFAIYFFLYRFYFDKFEKEEK